MDSAKKIQERLLKDRIVVLGEAIDGHAAAQLIAQLRFLYLQDAKTAVSIYVTSPGGVFKHGMEILSAMDDLTCPIHTYAIGNAAALACVIVAHGRRGHRFALPNSKLSINECWGNHTPAGNAEHIIKANTAIADLLAKDTGQHLEQVLKDLKSNREFNSDEAKAYGLVDDVLV